MSGSCRKVRRYTTTQLSHPVCSQKPIATWFQIRDTSETCKTYQLTGRSCWDSTTYLVFQSHSIIRRWIIRAIIKHRVWKIWLIQIGHWTRGLASIPGWIVRKSWEMYWTFLKFTIRPQIWIHNSRFQKLDPKIMMILSPLIKINRISSQRQSIAATSTKGTSRSLVGLIIC